LPPELLRSYKNILSNYNFKDSTTNVSIPRFLDGANLLEIPVALPDDDMLFDRLRIRDENELSKILLEIFLSEFIA